MAIAATLLIVAGVRLFVTSSDVETGRQPARWIGGVDLSGPLASRLAGPVSRGIRSAMPRTIGSRSIDEAGSAVVDSTMRDTSFVVSDSLLRNRRGLSWSVTATLGDGSTVSSLPVRLVPPAR